ncbi:MAG: hypothetical protein WC341_15120 [Bacteroidales bacterium]|jgi:hypothetical protein
MKELTKLLCGYLKNGTPEQKEMAEDVIGLLVQKHPEICTDSTNSCREINHDNFVLMCKRMMNLGPIAREQTVFTGDDILKAPDGVYEAHFTTETRVCAIGRVRGKVFNNVNEKWIHCVNWDNTSFNLRSCDHLEKLVLIRKA